MVKIEVRGDAHRATSAARRIGSGLLLSLLAALAITLAGPAAPASAEEAYRTEQLAQLNSFRAANGLGPVTLCANLNNAAQGHAEDMATRNYFSHTSPEGGTFVTRSLAAGYAPYTALGENIAKGYTTVTAVMNGWKDSPGHRANMLNPDYRHVGFGRAADSTGSLYWVQNFGAGGACGAAADAFTSSLETVSSPWPQTVHVKGWTFQNATPSTPLNVDVYANGSYVGRFPANKARTDVALVFPNAGANHGFDITLHPQPGTYNICVYAIGNGINGTVGCRVVSVANASPFGSLDGVVSPGPGQLRAFGWTIDPETTNVLGIHYYVDGQFAGQSQANTPRVDIGTLFDGYGNNHGFDATLNVGPGTHTLCAYAINQFLGSNQALGCRSASVASASPIGSLDDVAVVGPRIVNVRGWALDLETANAINVDIYVDGGNAGRFAANGVRNDILAAFGLGANHGYSVNLNLAPGAHTICVYGINAGARGSNSTLGCRSVTVPGDPIGSFESASVGGGMLRGSGWALDPDSASPIAVHVYIDGAFRGSVNANGARTDIAAAFPFFGPNHGFNFAFSVGAGSHTVCVYGINAGANGGNRLIACRAA